MNTGAAEEQCRLGDRHVHRIRHLHVQQKGFADMVQQHEQNHQAAQRVDGLKARRNGRGQVGGGHARLMAEVRGQRGRRP